MATRRKTTPAEQQRPAAVLQIAHQHFLLPFAAAQKVMDLMREAKVVEPNFSLRVWPQHWLVQPEAVPLEMSTVFPGQLQPTWPPCAGEGKP